MESNFKSHILGFDGLVVGPGFRVVRGLLVGLTFVFAPML
jgi:hypothetical protein